MDGGVHRSGAGGRGDRVVPEPRRAGARAAARTERQEIFQRKEPPPASSILSEAVLRDRLGGRGHLPPAAPRSACERRTTGYHRAVAAVRTGNPCRSRRSVRALSPEDSRSLLDRLPGES
ncbi:Scr1 family TA system antitoxin-like transcriptional regulator [Streptomyces sulphureus]|uniref:Scr1 family TA system antitoxin-like transcriptional regulator n=1 Tax=Streptomyces sulphureus TaxID=47758 RepID=UPI0003A064F5